MDRRGLIVAAVLASPAVAGALPGHGQTDGPGPAASLNEVLRPYLARYALPGLAAAVVQGGQIVASGALDTRRAGTETPVAIDDRFHIGSDTKAVTFLLAGTLVEQGHCNGLPP